MDLRIRVEGDGERRVVALEGSCDLASAPALREAMRPLCPPDVTSVLLDLTELDFLDSTGLGVVLGALRRLREGGGDLVVSGAHGGVLRVFEITGLGALVAD